MGTMRGPKKLAGELAVIVLGVLIALAVDASWDALQDRRARDELLNAIAADLAQASSELDEQLGALDEELADLERLLEMVYGDAPIDAEWARSALATSSDWADFPMGAYQGALNSGQLGLLPAQLNRELAVIPVIQGRVVDNVNLFLQLAYFGAYSEVVQRTGGMGPWLELRATSEAQVSEGLRTAAAQEGIEQLFLVQFNRRRMLVELTAQIDACRDLIAGEL